MDKENFPKIIYRFVRFTGFEKEKNQLGYYPALDNGKVVIGGKNSLQFIDEDATFPIDNEELRVSLKSHFIARTVICFTESLDNSLWDKFMPNFDKIAIGISTELQFLNDIEQKFGLKLSKVNYSDETFKYPKSYNEQEDTPTLQWIENVITTKHIEFSDEKEYRFWGRIKNHKPIGITKCIPLPEKCVREIIMGERISDCEKKNIIEFRNKYLPHVLLKIRNPSKDTFDELV